LRLATKKLPRRLPNRAAKTPKAKMKTKSGEKLIGGKACKPKRPLNFLKDAPKNKFLIPKS